MKPDRLLLKARLLAEQAELCPFCDEKATDMHEAFLKKGDLPTRRQAELDYLLSSFENCVVLCHEHHMQKGQTRKMEFDVLRLKALQYNMPVFFREVQKQVASWSSPAWDRSRSRLVLHPEDTPLNETCRVCGNFKPMGRACYTCYGRRCVAGCHQILYKDESVQFLGPMTMQHIRCQDKPQPRPHTMVKRDG